MNFLTENFPLDILNTFGLSVVAQHYAQFSNVAELRAILDECSKADIPYKILGGGSNTLFTGNYGGAIIQPTASDIVFKDDLIIAQAGAVWDDLVLWSIENGWQGLENLSLIPGTIGASPVQNIGAYGIEAGDWIEWVEYFDPMSDLVKRIDGVACNFGYRQSIFKAELSHAIVLSVAYRLNRENSATKYRIDYGDLRTHTEALGEINAQNIRKAVIKIRTEKLPDPKVLGNAGSFFKNPVITPEHFASLQQIYPNIPSYEASAGIKVPAGWLIDKAGLKGYRQGAVGIHEDQALVLVNYGGAKAEDVLNLAQMIEKAVYDKYGIAIEKEVTLV